MVICPCSTGTLAAVATGMSNSLLERAADVVIKERGQLILVPRETPFSSIHLEHMLSLSRLGATIMPAAPGFYHDPKSVEDLVDFMVARILDHLGVDHGLTKRWGYDKHSADRTWNQREVLESWHLIIETELDKIMPHLTGLDTEVIVLLILTHLDSLGLH